MCERGSKRSCALRFCRAGRQIDSILCGWAEQVAAHTFCCDRRAFVSVATREARRICGRRGLRGRRCNHNNADARKRADGRPARQRRRAHQPPKIGRRTYQTRTLRCTMGEEEAENAVSIAGFPSAPRPGYIVLVTGIGGLLPRCPWSSAAQSRQVLPVLKARAVEHNGAHQFNEESFSLHTRRQAKIDIGMRAPGTSEVLWCSQKMAPANASRMFM